MTQTDAIKATLDLYKLCMSGLFGAILITIVYIYKTLESPPTLNWLHYLVFVFAVMFMVLLRIYQKDVKRLEQL